MYLRTAGQWVHKTYTVVTEEALGRRMGAMGAGFSVQQSDVAANAPDKILSFPTSTPVKTVEPQAYGTPTLTLSNELSCAIDFPPWLLPDPEAPTGAAVPELYQYWNLSQWWPKCEGVPVRFSRVFFYFTNTLETPIPDDRPMWSVVQQYTTDDRPCVSDIDDGGEFDVDAIPKTFYFSMDDPVLIPFDDHGFPLMGVSFNHIGWVDQIPAQQVDAVSEPVLSADGDATASKPGPSTRSQSRLSRLLSTARRQTGSAPSSAPLTDGEEPEQPRPPKKRRIFRLVAFPPPGAPASLYAREARGERTLDIPEEVLDEALHIFLEPALGAVLILTSKNEIHRFDYA